VNGKLKKERQMTIEERFEFLTQSIESHDRQLGEITDKMADLTVKQDQLTTKFDQLTTKVDGLSGLMDKVLTSMHTLTVTVSTLADVANNHERRLTRIEGNAA
jgi:chromosome segregation ATPase